MCIYIYFKFSRSEPDSAELQTSKGERTESSPAFGGRQADARRNINTGHVQL